ncbi:alpha/beta fold hydrolase [Magnetospirillum molischianum]|uniref:Alpha/beta hydrolase n=1 Tax=Magnetospirillum molischianum DSM 120 TaxID=1150626 RepID=H8FSC8_MAGML|nr:alpha/beta hydrolase [Magnetospirillum molischianum]CCG41266.1 Alpha/beta hydrolase [Magnetospirillum molischianum DSM 120]
MSALWIDLAAGRQFIEVTEDRSDGPVAVLVHGAGSDHGVWTYQGAGLARLGWRVLAVDLPGHGRSNGAAPDSIPALADALAALLDAAGLPPGLVVGHSMGALAALDFAARYPGRLTGLALLGVAARMPVHPALLAAAHDDLPRAAAMIAGWGHAIEGTDAAEATRLLLERSVPGVLAAGLAACDAYDGSWAASRVGVPTTLILGEADKMSPAKAGMALAALIPGAHTRIIPGAGHMLMSEQPDAVLDALSDQTKRST